MKQYLRNTLIFLIVTSSVTAQNISIHDFRIPESRYQYLLGNLQGYYHSDRSGSSSVANTSRGGDYRLSLKNLFGYENENKAFVINTNIDGEYRNSTGSQTMYDSSPSSTDSKNFVEDGSIHTDGQYSTYLTPDQFYLYGSASLDASYSSNRYQSSQDGETEQATFSKDRTIDGSVGAGVGFGKMREASAVFAVIRILEKLQEDGYFTRELTKAEILEVVEIYARRIEYTSKYDRPTKYFLDDLMKKLESFGALKEQRASAYEAARVEEVFQETIFPRLVGWTIQGGVTFDRDQQEYIYEQANSQRSFTKTEQNYFRVSAAYGYPFSLSLHWYSAADVSLPLFGNQKKVDQFAQTSLYYQVGEKISDELSATFTKTNNYAIGNYVGYTSASTNTLMIGNTVRYFIENHVNFFVTVNYTDRMDVHEYNSGNSRGTNGGYGIFFGVNYRFF